MTFSTENIISILSIAGIGIGYFIYAGQLKEKILTNEKSIKNQDDTIEKNEQKYKEALDKQEEHFTKVLDDRLEYERKREDELEAMKGILEQYIKEQVRHEERLSNTQQQTSELKQEVAGIKETTAQIKQELSAIHPALKQLIAMGKHNEETLTKLMMKEKN